MNFYTVLATRPQYYDRNPLDVLKIYAASGVGPHANTTRWTYTVPSARKSFIEGVTFTAGRDAAATTAARFDVFLQITPNGGAATQNADVSGVNSAIGNQINQTMSSWGLLQAGDAISAVTADTSTGGTEFFLLSMKATEFDA